jgi:choline dehydrogenase-like flavoprotein
MRRRPRIGETNVLGEIAGVANAHVVDGACLPTLSEKSHTLTIMANADRIGRALAAQVMPS